MKTFEQIGAEIGEIVAEKNAAYGSSFAKAGEFLRLLYPNGLRPEQYADALLLVRIFDKQMRIATDRDALGESPYGDISGYGVLGVHLHQQRPICGYQWALGGRLATCQEPKGHEVERNGNPGSSHKCPDEYTVALQQKEVSETWRSSAKVEDAESRLAARMQGSAARNAGQKNSPNESAASETNPSPMPSAWSAAPDYSTAPAAPATAKESAEDRPLRAVRRARLTHTYRLWNDRRHNLLKCIACEESVMGCTKYEVPVRMVLGVIHLFTCSRDCQIFCLRLLRKGFVEGTIA